MTYAVVKKNDELYHHGVLGMKLGVRRYQNADGSLTEKGIRRRDKTISKIAKRYDKDNRYTDRKIKKLDAKGKTAKANVMREMKRRNETAKNEQIARIKNMNAEQYNKAKSVALKDFIFGGQKFMERNKTMMMTPLNRVDEYWTHRGMRVISNFTLNNTLERMSPREGYSYLDKKFTYSRGHNKGVDAGRQM